MNTQEKQKRLEEILKNNFKHEPIGIAIAITGSWGVGKTYFWNSFLEKRRCEERINQKETIFNRKYAYVSLFGVENLSDLKTQIYSNIESYHSTLEIPKWIKSLPSIFKDTRVTQLGINAPVKLIDNLMFSNVKDAIICFDDFERMSNKLDIKDVMGLANHLKIEKNCQIILILDEDKTENENKIKYADYKEKLIDETIIINSVEPLIRENAKDMENQLIELMIDFADNLEIHNFRFFQKVIKLYNIFIEQLPEVVATSTKEIILIRILQGYLIQDFSKLEYTWNDSKYFTENARKDWTERKNKTYDVLHEISYYFITNDIWLLEYRKWFEQKDDFDYQKIVELAQSDLISESNNIKKEEFHYLFKQFWGLTIDQSFPEKLYELSKEVIGLEGLHNLTFALVLLDKFGEFEKVSLLEVQIIEWIEFKLKESMNAFDEVNTFGNVWHSFVHYIEEFKEQNKLVGLPSLSDVVHSYLNKNGWNPEHTLALEYASKDEWKKLLFDEIPHDERFQYYNSNLIASKMIQQMMKPELNPKIRQIIIEIYEEKGQESEFYKKYMNYLISRLDD
ncbi:KAP family P-loop domain protein [Acinetobacter bereziniae]|uniref:KAP family P-loop domain protein n=1 Tax=Acinetobacter bereziniae TaxID=106648 RepID=UPI00124C1785|nr:KAP family P-loop domain protein [Acinetobacter bereziniae]